MKTKQVFKNAKWIIVCKIIQSVIQLVIGMISARYLGPSNYGLINYAASIVAFLLPIMRLGLNATLVNELLDDEKKEGEVLGTAVTMNIISSLMCMVGVTAFCFIANPGKTETIIVCILYSTSIFFAALEMVQYWFQYKLLSKYSSLCMLGAYIVVSFYKIFLLMTEKSVRWFAVSHSVEYGLIGIVLIILYLKLGKQRFSFSYKTAIEMLGRSKHYILSGLMVVIFQNTDHVMLTLMSGETENGYYSAAITCAGIAQFVYMAIIDSFRPLILSAKKEGSLQYEYNISRLYGVVVYLALAQSIVFTVMAPIIIQILYGEAYTASIVVLQVLTWYCAFSYMGSIRNIWLLAEQKQKLLPWINMSGAVLNVILNGILIPFFGAIGAAVASLVTQVFTNLILGFLIKPLRINNGLLFKGINPRFFVSDIGKLISELRKR